MMVLEIRSMTSPDVRPYAWSPEARNDVYFVIELEIGRRGDPRADLFQVLVATPEGLRARGTGDDVIVDRNALVLSEFVSWPRLRDCLQRIVDSCAREEWRESVARLQRYFQWEYEDYKA
jgi:Immunity protein 8